MEGIYDNISELPEGWQRVSLGDVITVIRGASPRPKGDPKYFGGDIPWIMISDITREKGKYISQTKDHVTKAGAGKSRYLKAGTLILSNSGTVCVPKILSVDGCIHDGFVAFPDLSDDFDILYLYYFFEYIRPRIINAHRQGITQVNLNTGIVKEIKLPFAPLEQQKRIVAEIEKQFSRLDEAVTNLKRVKANLKRYKAAVLKAAVEGKLTEEWRQQHPDVEPVSKLLERILTERRQKWEGKGKYKDPSAPDTTDLPKLPGGWIWSTFEAVAKRVTVGHVGSMKNEYVDQGIPFLRSQNVRPNRYDPEGLKYISTEFHKQLKKSTLNPGDIVVVRSGSVGVSCVIPENLPEANCSDLVIIQTPEAILPEYGAYYMNSVVETRVAAGKVGVALTHFNTKSVASLPLPLPPVEEQRRIVDEVGSRLSCVREVEFQLEANFKRAERLRQSILSKAFSGGVING